MQMTKVPPRFWIPAHAVSSETEELALDRFAIATRKGRNEQ